MSELITVLFGGPSAEHDISILTGLQCERVLVEAGDQVQCVYWDRGGSWHLVPAATEARDYLEGAPKGSTELEIRLAHGAMSFQPVKGMRKRPVELGVVLLALHGGAGESGGAQSLFAMMDVPATGYRARGPSPASFPEMPPAARRAAPFSKVSDAPRASCSLASAIIPCRITAGGMSGHR